jgi:hypothetical protein
MSKGVQQLITIGIGRPLQQLDSNGVTRTGDIGCRCGIVRDKRRSLRCHKN